MSDLFWLSDEAWAAIAVYPGLWNWWEDSGSHRGGISPRPQLINAALLVAIVNDGHTTQII